MPIVVTDEMYELSETHETLSELYERVSNFYIPREAQFTSTVGDLLDFVYGIHAGLLKNFDFTPKAKTS
jgi:hypothetical protein